MRRLTNVGVILALVTIALLTWLGQQRSPDRYLDAIMSRGALRVGLDPTYPPFESLEDGAFVGRDIALAHAIAAGLGVRVEFKALALDTLYDALASNQVDMLVSALPFVYERQKEVRYSTPYYQAGQVIVARPNDAFKATNDLLGKRVGVELGSNADTEARRLARFIIPTMQVKSDYRSAADALDALIRGEVDTVIADNTSAQEYIIERQGALTVLSPPLTDEPFVVAMPAQANILAERVDTTIARLRNSGELERIMANP